MFRSLRATISAYTLLSILFSSAAIMVAAVFTYENLYSESAIEQLDGISENLASDLIPGLAGNIDHLAISTTLLRLNAHDNIKHATVFDAEKNLIQTYVGADYVTDADTMQEDEIQRTEDLAFSNGPGVFFTPENNVVIAYKLIGDVSLPVGYLLVTHDISNQLSVTKNRFFFSVMPFVIAIVVISVLLHFWLQNKVLTPLVELGRFTHKIRQTKDYSLTATINGKQEIIDLTKSFNALMRAINEEIASNNKKTVQLVSQQEQMERLANYDVLTGLPNRQYIIEKLHSELRSASDDDHNVALLFFDLDGFKDVNDSHGHDIGDALLIEVARTVKSLLRDCDIAARLGGDEFLVLVKNGTDDTKLMALAQRIIAGLSIPFEVEGWTLQVGVSVGIAKASDASYEGTTLISNADIAMYSSKLEGKGRATLFTQKLMDENKRKIQIAQLIPEAIEQRIFTVHYQPQVNAQLHIVGYEALIRWTDKTLGAVPPSEFIGIAEKAGKISQITRYVISQVCADIGTISAQAEQQVTIAINLSVHDLRDNELVDYIETCFTDHAVDPCAIEFEITESTYLENLATANDFISRIKAMGCSIALDDFGTGYSSLGYLTRIKIDTLKIDKQFIDSIDSSEKNRLITKTIIEMAKQLNLKICAEGVEYAQQIDFLVEHGCHYLQGYYFSHPKPLHKIIEEGPLACFE